MGLGNIMGGMGLKVLMNMAQEEEYVVMGAATSCTFGSMDSRLIVPLSHGVYIHGKAQLNIMDFKPIINVLPFGRCSSLVNPIVAAATAAKQGVLTPMPCIPVICMPWLQGKTDKLIEKFPALLIKSMNMCLFCGMISIENSGQS